MIHDFFFVILVSFYHHFYHFIHSYSSLSLCIAITTDVTNELQSAVDLAHDVVGSVITAFRAVGYYYYNIHSDYCECCI